MKALAVSDKIISFVYSPAIRERFADVDLVISCGDLPYYYLEYIISTLDKPLFFVRGNHAHLVEHGPGGPRTQPWGAVDLHNRVVEHNGLLLAGFEGSIRYNKGPFQYTEQEMWGNVARLIPRLLLNRVTYGRYLDILVTHAPPYQVQDGPDRCHRGFKAFRWLLKWLNPGTMLHGHIHVYHPKAITHSRFHRTDVVNCYGYRLLHLSPDGVEPDDGKGWDSYDRTTGPRGLRAGNTKSILESDKELDYRSEQ